MLDSTHTDASCSFAAEGGDQVKQLLEAVVRALPFYCDLTLHLREVEKDARASGGNCDIFHGAIPSIATSLHRKPMCLQWPTDSLAVAIRRPRFHALSSMDVKRFNIFMKRAVRELWIWSELDHPNILPFLGYANEGRAFPSLITAWMKNGTAKHYLKRCGSAYIMTLVKGVVCGLKYLHDECIVHGDLKAENVLISDDGTPLLSDFGISHVLMSENTAVIKTSSGNTSGTLRWMAYEQLTADYPIYTIPTDIWAFGMTVYEFLTGRVPYEHIQSDPAVMRAIMSCKSPHDSTDIENLDSVVRRFLWHICRRCWNISPEERPYMYTILEEIAILEYQVTIASSFNFNQASSSFGYMTSQMVSPMDVDRLQGRSPMSICSRSSSPGSARRKWGTLMDIDNLQGWSPMRICSRHSSPKNTGRKRGSPMDIDRLCKSTSTNYRHSLCDVSSMDLSSRFGFNESGGALQGITYDKASTLSLDPSQFSTSFTSWEQFVNDVF